MNNKQKINAIAVNVKNILETVGLDTTDPSIKDTPMRVAKMYVNEIFFALGGKPPKCTVFPNDGNNQMVLIRKIDFYSVCEHHLVPFVGQAYCAYLPDKKLLGLSKFNRVVNYFASKPQLQERLTTEIAEYLSERLGTDNVAVLVCAEHYCYDDQTEILTTNGFKYFKDLLPTDNVAQYNMESTQITFVKPTKYYSLAFDGKMVNVKTKNLSFCVTPDHRVVHQTEWNHYNKGTHEIMLANDLRKLSSAQRLYIPRAGTFEGNNIQHIKIAGKYWNANTFAQFMGAFLSEGCTYYNKGSRAYKTVITQNYASKGYKEYKVLANMLPLHCYEAEQPCGKQAQFIIHSKELHNYLKKFGKSGDKYVPSEIKTMGIEQRKQFLHYYHLGDGWTRNAVKNTGGFTTKSYQMASDLQELLSLSGVSAYLSKRNTKHEAYDVYTHYTKSHNRGYKTHTSIKAKDISTVKYSGTVYCVEVPDSALVVRRNGSVFVSGNCCKMRGIKDQSSDTVTSHLGGAFSEGNLRNEFLQLIGKL